MEGLLPRFPNVIFASILSSPLHSPDQAGAAGAAASVSVGSEKVTVRRDGGFTSSFCSSRVCFVHGGGTYRGLGIESEATSLLAPSEEWVSGVGGVS